ALCGTRVGNEASVAVAQAEKGVVVAREPRVEKGGRRLEGPAGVRRGPRIELDAAAARAADVAELGSSADRRVRRRVLSVAVEDEAVAVDLEDRRAERRRPSGQLHAPARPELEADRLLGAQVGVAVHERIRRGLAAEQLLCRRQAETGRCRREDRTRVAQRMRETGPVAVDLERATVRDRAMAVARHGGGVEVDVDEVAPYVER